MIDKVKRTVSRRITPTAYSAFAPDNGHTTRETDAHGRRERRGPTGELRAPLALRREASPHRRGRGGTRGAAARTEAAVAGCGRLLVGALVPAPVGAPLLDGGGERRWRQARVTAGEGGGGGGRQGLARDSSRPRVRRPKRSWRARGREGQLECLRPVTEYSRRVERAEPSRRVEQRRDELRSLHAPPHTAG